jgi:WD40 repeat protein
VAFAPDGRSLAAGCVHFNDDGTSGHVRIRDARTGASVGSTIDGAAGGVLAITYAPDGCILATTGRNVVEHRNLSDPVRPLARRLDGYANSVYAVAFNPDGDRPATGGWDKTIRI